MIFAIKMIFLVLVYRPGKWKQGMDTAKNRFVRATNSE